MEISFKIDDGEAQVAKRHIEIEVAKGVVFTITNDLHDGLVINKVNYSGSNDGSIQIKPKYRNEISIQ